MLKSKKTTILKLIDIMNNFIENNSIIYNQIANEYYKLLVMLLHVEKIILFLKVNN